MAYQVKMDNYYDNNNNLNVILQFKCEDLIQDLDGIQRTFKTKLGWILKKYRVDNDNTFETELKCTVRLMIPSVSKQAL